MPRKASAPKKQQASKRTAGFSDTPRIMSDEEKRGLIMAHAAARAPQDPLQRMSLWAGVTLSVIMLIAGWWLTVGWSVRQTIVGGSPELQALTEKLNQFADRVEADPTLGLDELRNPTAQVSASAFDDLLKQHLDGDATSTERDLIAPSSTRSYEDTNPPGEVSSGLTPETP